MKLFGARPQMVRYFRVLLCTGWWVRMDENQKFSCCIQNTFWLQKNGRRAGAESAHSCSLSARAPSLSFFLSLYISLFLSLSVSSFSDRL